MVYGSVCSGIEAATVAWHSLGWKAGWFSQYDPEWNYSRGLDFPSRVLNYHYPQVENLGDMTKIYEKEKFKSTSIELLVGGTPCQSFSVAGLRGGLGDQRGNLSLEYCRILIAKQPRWFVWENVPGVYSSFSDEEESKVYPDGSGESGGGNGGGTTVLKPQILQPCYKDFGNAGIVSHTECLTLNISECHRDAGVSSLSDILETTGDHLLRYCLSGKACAGILRRAERRKGNLPDRLSRVLLKTISTISE